MSLRVEKQGGTCPWQVVIAEGPSEGVRVGWSHKTKRDALAYVERWARLPWSHVIVGINEAVAKDEPIVTVPTSNVAALLRRCERAEVERDAARLALLEFDGSAMALARAEDSMAKQRAARTLVQAAQRTAS